MNLPHREREVAGIASDTQNTTVSDTNDVSQYLQNSLSTSPPRLIRSRRKRWLELNPSYFSEASKDLELSDPLSYDRLIRQHQSAAEREHEGKAKGWAKTLETSLIRGEAKLAEMNPASHNDDLNRAPIKTSSRDADWSIDGLSPSPSRDVGASSSNSHERVASAQSIRPNQDRAAVDGDQTLLDDSDSDTALRPGLAEQAKLHGEQRWHSLLAQRFISGEDEEFDYSTVDRDDTLDTDDGVNGGWLERERQARWFDDEDSEADRSPGQLEGETGVQDF